MKVIIHGGFFNESSTDVQTKKVKQDALISIVQEAFEYLRTHNALDTVIYATCLLENDPLFNAGTGSQIQSDGKIRMSAAIIDGATQLMSGVMNIENVKNPVLVAQRLMQEDDRILAGEGATAFAQKNGFEFYDPETEERRAEYLEKKKSNGSGTVGCVVLDSENRIAVATSTGGKGFEIVGRVSDSATVAGNYANAYCGVSCTGVGEDIVSGAVASKIVTRVTDDFSLKEAFSKTFDELKPFDGFAGAIAIDVKGNIYHQSSHPKMVFAWTDGQKTEIFQ